MYSIYASTGELLDEFCSFSTELSREFSVVGSVDISILLSSSDSYMMMPESGIISEETMASSLGLQLSLFFSFSSTSSVSLGNDTYSVLVISNSLVGSAVSASLVIIKGFIIGKCRSPIGALSFTNSASENVSVKPPRGIYITWPYAVSEV
jgi:hypothetical protein